MVRLQKFLSEAGVASRRAAEKLILDGHVEVNGETVRVLGTKVDPERDLVHLDGQNIKLKRKIYLALNKPPGCVCTRNDPEQRATVGEFLPAEWGHLYPVGRLDYASEGLLFLTNDGDFCLKLTHPRYGVRKIYQATVEGRVEQEQIEALTKGVYEGGERMKAERARILSANNSHSLIEVVLAEGKNREVRRMLSVLGFTVERLQRIQIGPIKLGELPQGRWRTLTGSEISSLLGNKYENDKVDMGRARNSARPGARQRQRIRSRG